MSFDTKVPKELKEIQTWFGSIITRAIDDNNQMNPISPRGVPMEKEAAKYITPSHTLSSAQRIQLYNQQYWWRLIGVLQDAFPTLLRLFGHYDFNELIVKPYICKYPPNHWSLNQLGDRLSLWIQKKYQAKDKELIYEMSKIDWAYYEHFFSHHHPLMIADKDPEQLLSVPLSLQPHVRLFNLKRDLFLLRDTFLKEETDHWVQNDFPPLPLAEQCNFILYRNLNHDSAVKKISLTEYHLLQQFQKEKSIEKACQWLEKQSDAVCEEAATHLQTWIQSWIVHQWVYIKDNKVQR